MQDRKQIQTKSQKIDKGKIERDRVKDRKMYSERQKEDISNFRKRYSKIER